MSGNQARLGATSIVANLEALEENVEYFDIPTGSLFGTNVFSIDKMKARLPKAIFKSVEKTIKNRSILDASVADAVASAMRDWALEKGATHYAHIFYPLTGLMAEKHDSFFEPNGTGTIAEFNGATLIQGEPDGSSFPSGGIRQTHEARGYTAWDVTSPAYILETANGSTLFIPTAFVSWSGQSTDMKTPLLRAMQALDTQSRRLLGLLGEDDQTLVVSTAGPEQEYFLVDKNFYYARPDLVAAGRTVFGAAPAKGQQFDDHYFGPIQDRVLNYMQEVERELFKLGVPAKTRHNEVAPGQFEIAPVYEDGNVAADHQQLLMLILKKVADRHGLVCLMHEKPFAGINGSGKHLNFSLGNGSVGNILEPTDTPHENGRFLLFCAGIIRAVDKNASLLRASVASASNDHRLGANEAPPAIMSIFLGDQLDDVFAQIKENGVATSSLETGAMDLGVSVLSMLPKHSGDRNRTSPIAFTGNRFEFRAVGSSQSITWPLTIWNVILAESLDYISTQMEGGAEANAIIQQIMNDHGRVIFNGDGYADAWHKEAEEERGMPNLRTSADALPVIGGYTDLFAAYGVLNETELNARQEVFLEQYCMAVDVEAKLVERMGRTMILPAAIRYASELAVSGLATRTLAKLTSLINDLEDGLDALSDAMAHENGELAVEAAHMRDAVLPVMLAIRGTADALELMVADDLWPLPSYQEMLFTK